MNQIILKCKLQQSSDKFCGKSLITILISWRVSLFLNGERESLLYLLQLQPGYGTIGAIKSSHQKRHLAHENSSQKMKPIGNYWISPLIYSYPHFHKVIFIKGTNFFRYTGQKQKEICHFQKHLLQIQQPVVQRS